MRGKSASVAGVLIVTMIACVGCGQSDEGGDDSEATSSCVSPSPSVDPGFFTWQEAEGYSGDEADVAATVRASQFYLGLLMRNGNRPVEELSPVLTEYQADDWEYPCPKDPVGPNTRGPVAVRLMDISEHNGDPSWVTVTICEDNSGTETRHDGGEWKPRDEDSYSVFTYEYLKMPSSPTGWQMSHTTVDDPIDTDDCAEAFDNDKPAVEKTGPPSLED